MHFKFRIQPSSGSVDHADESLRRQFRVLITLQPPQHRVALQVACRRGDLAEPPKLPSDAGQYYEEYDLRPYTKELSTIDRPQQAIVDWVLRETGSDAWFTEPFGFVNADRNTLRVYHNEQMHQLVRGVHEKFVNGTTAPPALRCSADSYWKSKLADARACVDANCSSSIAWC